MTEHTPGPWQTFAGVVFTRKGRVAVATTEEDAHLIAAAPALLAACRALLEEITTLAGLWTEGDSLALDATYRRRTDEARAAIARARGEQP